MAVFLKFALKHQIVYTIMNSCQPFNSYFFKGLAISNEVLAKLLIHIRKKSRLPLSSVIEVSCQVKYKTVCSIVASIGRIVICAVSLCLGPPMS